MKDTKSIKLSSCATEQSSSFSDLKSNNDHEVISKDQRCESKA